MIFRRSSHQKEADGRRAALFKNILVATDGSDLAVKAVEQGILFAKEVGAKITAVTVNGPFNVPSLSPSELGYTPIEYKKYAEAYAEKLLESVSTNSKPPPSSEESGANSYRPQRAVDRAMVGCRQARSTSADASAPDVRTDIDAVGLDEMSASLW
jgi:nucleotide-binding universal stress UspA family protein